MTATIFFCFLPPPSSNSQEFTPYNQYVFSIIIPYVMKHSYLGSGFARAFHPQRPFIACSVECPIACSIEFGKHSPTVGSSRSWLGLIPRISQWLASKRRPIIKSAGSQQNGRYSVVQGLVENSHPYEFGRGAMRIQWKEVRLQKANAARSPLSSLNLSSCFFYLSSLGSRGSRC